NAMRAWGAALMAAACVTASAQSPHERLGRLAHESYSRYLDLFPHDETLAIGAGPRMARLEMHVSVEHERRQRRHFNRVLSHAKAIPERGLKETDAVTHRLLREQARWALERLDFPLVEHTLLIPLDGGLAVDLVQLMTRQPFRNASDYRAWLQRLGRFPALLAAARERLRAGLDNGVTTPRILVERSLDQWAKIASDEASRSTLWAPAARFPDSMDAAARERFRDDYARLLDKSVLPAMREFARFVREEYLPKARTSDGIGALPDGERMYRTLVRQQTTTDLTPDAIHRIGLAEVQRIQLQVMLAAGQAGYKGELRDLRTWLRTDPANFPFATSDEVLVYLRGIHARIVPRLPRLFARLPRIPLEIRLTDPALAASMPAQWLPPSADGTRPGIFAMPVVDPREVSTVTLASLLAHEGMPGHHLEGALARELPLPAFRRDLWINAYGEGWALYAESLGHEMGLYEDTIPLVGRYLDELYRAARLVADTGVHAKGWSRERAIEFMMNEGALAERSATREVLRYMAWPAQALGYKLGEIAIRDLRSEAERRLGERFDLREFHRCVLGQGQVPLDLLRSRVEAWISARSAAAAR
ncbi:MAG: DUF885 domain-containing protein, partial [Burkholderiales bacterium]|nr:DUF885 domain-containing protein [Burkholderiales bacterium]